MDVISSSFKRRVFSPSLPLKLKSIHKTKTVNGERIVALRRPANNKFTGILYEALESLVSGLTLIFLTSLPSIMAYSVVFGWNFGVSLPGQTKTFPSPCCSVNRNLITRSCYAMQILRVNLFPCLGQTKVSSKKNCLQSLLSLLFHLLILLFTGRMIFKKQGPRL